MEKGYYNVHSKAANSQSVAELIEKLQVTTNEIEEIEKETRGQSDNPKWAQVRAGRLTASNFYRIYTRINSLKENPHTDLSKLVSSLLHPTSLDHLSQIARGKELEGVAVDTLTNLLKQKHKNVKYFPCGVFLDKDSPFLAASPDGIVECDCHGRVLVEIKCPSLDLTQLKYLDEGKLRCKSNYYGQIQGQMMITKIHCCYFFVYYSAHEYLLDSITSDPKFIKELRSNLSIFFIQFIAPKLILQPSAKVVKLV